MQLFKNLGITGEQLIFLDNDVNISFDKLMTEEVYFTILNRNIYLASKLKSIILERKENGQSSIMCDHLKDCYLESGLVVPPFTIFKNIFKMPVFSKFIKEDGQFLLDFDYSCLSAVPFKNDSDIFNHLSKVLESRVNSKKTTKVICTLSGGADSAVLLSLLAAIKPTKDIVCLSCKMPGHKREILKAESIAKVFNTKFVVFEPNLVNPKDTIDKYVDDYGNLVFDPVVPILSSMLKEQKYFNNSKIDDHVYLVEGQGADTVMFGLPHALTLAVHSIGLSFIFRGLSIILPRPSEALRSWSRVFYRLIKAIHLLSEKTWQGSILHSLDLHNLRNTHYYNCYNEMITFYYDLTKDRQKALVFFFSQIISTREIQKYHLLGKKNVPVLPFMEQAFVERCLASRTSMFFSFPKRKIPIFNKTTEIFGKIFNSQKTIPFVVSYSEAIMEKDESNKAINNDYSFRNYCLKELMKKNKLEN